jgi:hypothetical protein
MGFFQKTCFASGHFLAASLRFENKILRFASKRSGPNPAPDAIFIQVSSRQLALYGN